MGTQQEHEQVVSGVIFRRRCLGKHLAFATIVRQRRAICDKVNENEDDDDEDAVEKKVVFRRAKFDESNSPLSFPSSRSALPYGALVQVHVVRRNTTDDDDENRDSPLEVRTWTVLNEHPRAQALKQASVGESTAGGKGISCSKYFAQRAETFRKLHGDDALVAPRRDPREGTREATSPSSSFPQPNDPEASPHGNPAMKTQRTKIFASWLVENVLKTPPPNSASSGGPSAVESDRLRHRVLDVAGGRGQLTIALSRFDIESTVVDPLIRSKRNQKKLDKSRKNLAQPEELPTFLASRFGKDAETAELVQNYTCLVGFHPDECTEDVLDMALEHNKSVAIVPCCVFSEFLSHAQAERWEVCELVRRLFDFPFGKGSSPSTSHAPFLWKESRYESLYVTAEIGGQ